MVSVSRTDCVYGSAVNNGVKLVYTPVYSYSLFVTVAEVSLLAAI